MNKMNYLNINMRDTIVYMPHFQSLIPRGRAKKGIVLNLDVMQQVNICELSSSRSVRIYSRIQSA